MRTIQVTAAEQTLFHVAADELRDPLTWWQIAQTSGVTDPWLAPAMATLTIPAQGQDDGGGLPT